MKDFIKWLGVNEKVAKVAVWMLIIMVFLIVTNTMLGSLGFPNYQITYDNLMKIKVNDFLNIIFSWIISILNFYSITLLVFRINKARKILKYAILYLILAILVKALTNYAVTQIFILVYIILFCFKFSKNNWKYIFYGLSSLIINVLIQYICYLYKLRFIDMDATDYATKIILSCDYFIIIGIIIVVKEIYLKKRGEKKCGEMHQVGSGLENSKKKTN